MKSYWLWLLLHVIVWLLALLYSDQSIGKMIWNLFGTALYFIIFFITPLVKHNATYLVTLLGINAVIVILTLHPMEGVAFNPYLILILTLVLAEGFYHLHIKDSLVLGGFIFVGIIAASFTMELYLYTRIYIFLYWILVVAAMIIIYLKSQEHP